MGNAGGANGGSGNAGGSNGGTPNGGNATTGGAGGATPPPPSGGDVLERNGGPTRDGHWVQPGLTKAAAAKMIFQDDFKATFTGSMFAAPLFVEKGPGGKAAFIAVSASNDVAALDETTGATLWSKNLGTGAAQGCGSFTSDPVGILSTPVIDGKSGTLYVAAAVGKGGSGAGVMNHEIHALSLEDGSEKQGWPVTVNGMKSGSNTFAAQYQNQRSALSLVNGVVYVGYGGFVGDCNDYRGWIVAVDAADPAKSSAWATAGKGEAIWAAGGFASDGTAIFPVTGNSKSQAASRDATNSEAVLRITGMAQFDGTDKSEFYPSQWKSMDSADADLGGSNSMLVTVPGSTPEKLVVAIGKDGRLFLLDPNNLGGEDGSVVELQVASTSSGAQGAVKTAPTAYQTAKGTYIAFTADSGPDCPTAINGRAIMAVKISPGAPPTADVAWCAPGPNPSTAPISTTTDGKSDPIVWYVAGGQLKGVDGDTGESVFGGAGMCSGVQRWSSPIAVKNRVVAGGNGRLCSWAAP
jgi:hypothetical protein